MRVKSRYRPYQTAPYVLTIERNMQVLAQNLAFSKEVVARALEMARQAANADNFIWIM